MLKTAKKSSKYCKTVFILIVMLIPVIVCLLSFSSVVYDRQQIESHMEKAGLFFNAKEINSYVVHYLASPDETELIKLDVFDAKEQQHLLDVKKAFHRVFDALFIVLAVFFCLAYFNHKLSKSRNWGRILIYSGMISAAVPIILCILPFDFLFTHLHSVFFAQGSWVFPAGSALVQIYPLEFWQSISFSLFLKVFVTGWVLILAGFIVDRTR